MNYFASIIPAAALSKEEIAVLRQQAQAQIAEATARKALGMKPDEKGNLPHAAFDTDGNQLFGRGVEKVSLNLRLDKPMADLLKSHCDKMGMTKTAAVRQMILVQVA
jgi:predicted ATPase